jgi:ATP-dependent helicase HrpA
VNRASGAGRQGAVERRRVVHAALLVGGIRWPELPVVERHDDLAAAIRDHQVVVVAGETGSGKSTQLPKLCLELDRGVDGLIGHTQPRRVAARTIAARVAEELGTTVGEAVGYSVRFDDRVGDGTLIRVMTDGVLLSEMHRDRLLRRYDTLIVDEAHERSLNIDFLLGYIRRLLPRRPDLKVIVTSATIDTERFARHFAADGVDAPIVEVTGRTYPVEVRYRPFGADVPETGTRDDRDQVQAIIDAVAELGREGPGDVLVFLSGEREIHDTADALRRLDDPGLEVLPLYARLSAAEQHRIFEPHPMGRNGRRVVLSTNVAETSLTVPGVRYVVDAGTARISRFSRRLKVQRLPIEPVSQASANQRAGRCGRVAPGICVRLYSEEDFTTRPEFTEPEILRTNLAAVILQMLDIGLGDIAEFPFVEAPDTATIRDGYLLLDELAAITDEGDRRDSRLTSIGKRLARLPIDPRLGRMVLEADRLGCLREVLVIAAALSIQDPRERPQDATEQANQFHRRFDVPNSDLLALVGLWDYLRAEQQERSSNQFRKLCRTEFLNYLRVREWQDLYSQLRRAAGDLGLRLGSESAHPDHVHQAVLAGLLSHIGVRDRDRREYRGARASTFVIGRDSTLSKKSPAWVMAAELVETNRLWARKVAAIQPEWAERAGAHLVKRSYGEPRWDERSGRAVTTETVTLYGLPIVSGRTVGLDRVDAELARELFIRHALVLGDAEPEGSGLRHALVRRNREFLDEVAALEARVRRGHLLDDDAVERLYDGRVPHDIVSTRHFERWLRTADADEVARLELTADDLRDRSGAAVQLTDWNVLWPSVWRQGDLELPLGYRFEPGQPLDGVTVRIPLLALNQVVDDGFDWQIPGYREELVGALARTLPKDVRRALIPQAETVAAAMVVLGELSRPDLGRSRGRLVDALADALSTVAGVRVRPGDFDVESVPEHLRVHFVVVDESGRVHDAGDDLGAIRNRIAGAARQALAAASPIEERRGIVTWDVGSIPKVVEASRGGVPVRGYPALLDDDDSVSLRVFTNDDLQRRVMRGGVRRLLLLTAAPSMRGAESQLTNAARLAMSANGTAPAVLVAECMAAAVDHLLSSIELPWDEDAYAAVEHRVRDKAGPLAAAALTKVGEILVVAHAIRQRLDRLVAESLRPSVADARSHLGRLVRSGFVQRAGLARLPDVLRYVRGIEHRLERLAEDVARDRRRMGEVRPLEQRYAAFVDGLGRGPVGEDVVAAGWQLEELRIAVFAQPVGAKGGPSVIKLTKLLGTLGA